MLYAFIVILNAVKNLLRTTQQRLTQSPKGVGVSAYYQTPYT